MILNNNAQKNCESGLHPLGCKTTRHSRAVAGENDIKEQSFSTQSYRGKKVWGSSKTTGISIGYVKNGMSLVGVDNTEHISYDRGYNWWSDIHSTKETYVEDWIWNSPQKSYWLNDNWKTFSGEVDRVDYMNVNIRK